MKTVDLFEFSRLSREDEEEKKGDDLLLLIYEMIETSDVERKTKAVLNGTLKETYTRTTRSGKTKQLLNGTPVNLLIRSTDHNSLSCPVLICFIYTGQHDIRTT